MDQLQRIPKYTRGIQTPEALEKAVVRLLKDAARLAVLLAQNPDQGHYHSAAANRLHEGRHNWDALTDAQINLAYLNSPLLPAELRDEADATTVFLDNIYNMIADTERTLQVADAQTRAQVSQVAGYLLANMECVGTSGGIPYEPLCLEMGLKGRIQDRIYQRDHPEVRRSLPQIVDVGAGYA